MVATADDEGERSLPVLEEVERQALEDADQSLARIQTALEEAARRGAIDSDVIDRLAATARDAAGRVNSHLPPDIDAQAADEIRRRLLDVLTMDLGGAPPLDVADHILVETEAVRHVVRDLLQEQPPVELRDAREVIHLLEAWLPGVGVARLAELLGLSERQLQRRRRAGGMASARTQLVARLVAILRHSWTDQGVLTWFYRERRDLGELRPIDLLDDPGNERALLMAARAGRVQGGV